MPKVQTITREAMRPLIEPYGLAEAAKAGGLLYVAGQTGIGEDHQLVAGGLRAQALQAFRNIRAIIELAGGDPEDLVHLTWHLADGPRSFMEDALDVTAAREEVFPGVVTGSTAVRVKALLTPELLIEIQAVAAL
ncbi:MAG TPA: RidA family protein [Caulobacteraceae bacterium]|jgi:enamine deaminase RidA (YjgF/YER057c/UK114 family)|nr:RidA family protein [Caulobacteraceae bacterium]